MRLFSRKGFTFLSVVAVLVAGALQANGMISIFGIRPNVLLALLIILALFTEEFSTYLVLVLLGSMSIMGSIGFPHEATGLAVISLLVFWLKSRRVTQTLAGTLILVATGTLLLYLILAPGFLYRWHTVVLVEVLYNVIVGVLLFEACRWYRRRQEA